MGNRQWEMFYPLFSIPYPFLKPLFIALSRHGTTYPEFTLFQLLKSLNRICDRATKLTLYLPQKY